MRLSAADRIMRIKRANEWRGACGKPRRRRSEGTGEACLLLRCAGIKEIAPRVDSDVLKFWLIGASYSDGNGLAFASYDEFKRYGYHPTTTKRMLELLDSLGLIRYVRKGERDRVTGRMLPNVYQFHPALVYIRKANRPAALALSDTPFADRLVSPTHKVREEREYNQVLENPILQTKTSKPRPQTNESTGSREGGKPRQYAQPPAVSDTETHVESFDTESNAPTKQGERPVKHKPRSASGRKPQPTPPPQPPAPPAGSELYRVALDNESHERLAEKLNALTGDMSLPNARYLVTAFGESPCSSAIQAYCAKPIGSVANPAGWIRSAIERKAKKAGIMTADSNSKIVTADEWWTPKNQERNA